jgi:hypothetical protein
LAKISHNPFPNIKCNNTSAKEIERIRPATSTDKASYRLINEILNVINERKMVGGILLTKLEFYGVTETTLKLLKS